DPTQTSSRSPDLPRRFPLASTSTSSSASSSQRETRAWASSSAAPGCGRFAPGPPPMAYSSSRRSSIRTAGEPRGYARGMAVDWDWTRVVLDHVHVRVRHARDSIAFYGTVLEPLGIPALWERDDGAQFANLVVSDDLQHGGPIHIAFVADSREQV